MAYVLTLMLVGLVPSRLETLQLRENLHDAADLRSRSFSLLTRDSGRSGWQVLLNTHIATYTPKTTGASARNASVYVVVLV